MREKIKPIGNLQEQWRIFESQEYVEYDSPSPGLTHREPIACFLYRASSENQAEKMMAQIQEIRINEGWKRTSQTRLEKECDSMYGNLELNYRIRKEQHRIRKAVSRENWEV